MSVANTSYLLLPQSFQNSILLVSFENCKDTKKGYESIEKDCFIVYRLLLQHIQNYTNNSDNIISDYL